MVIVGKEYCDLDSNSREKFNGIDATHLLTRAFQGRDSALVGQGIDDGIDTHFQCHI